MQFKWSVSNGANLRQFSLGAGCVARCFAFLTPSGLPIGRLSKGAAIPGHGERGLPARISRHPAGELEGCPAGCGTLRAGCPRSPKLQVRISEAKCVCTSGRCPRLQYFVPSGLLGLKLVPFISVPREVNRTDRTSGSAHRVPSRSTRPSSAFSLIELLVVIAIIVILSVLATAGLNSVSRSTKLANTAQRLGDQIALARQTAVARNLPVEVRLYKLPEFDSTTGGASLWRGTQLFILDGAMAVPASRLLLFPHRVIVSENATVSPLLQNSSTGLGAEITPTSNVGAFSTGNVRYKAFTIRPNGTLAASNSIPDLNWFFTLHQENDQKPDGLKPANFVTIQINPVTSKVTVLRP